MTDSKPMELFESKAIEFTPFGPAGIRKGSIEAKVFSTGEMFPGTSFFYSLMRYGANGDAFETPRHHHSFQQVRYVVSGSHNYGPKRDLPAGWCGYFPAGAYYGPQKDIGGHVLYLQWGENYVTPDDQIRALKEMSEVGEFKNGVYSTIDPETGKKHNQDGSAAMYEYVNKVELVYPEPRYEDPIPINPAAFEWRELDDNLLYKPLGTLTEDGLSLWMMHWEGPCEYSFPVGDSQFLFTTADGVVVDGKSRPAETAAYSPVGHLLELDGESGGEAFVIGVPTTA
jgi:hypothetical protein